MSVVRSSFGTYWSSSLADAAPQSRVPFTAARNAWTDANWKRSRSVSVALSVSPSSAVNSSMHALFEHRSPASQSASDVHSADALAFAAPSSVVASAMHTARRAEQRSPTAQSSLLAQLGCCDSAAAAAAAAGDRRALNREPAKAAMASPTSASERRPRGAGACSKRSVSIRERGAGTLIQEANIHALDFCLDRA